MSLLAKRGTRSQVDAAGAGSDLLESEIVYLTDEKRFAVATGTGTTATIGGYEIGDVTRRAQSPGATWLALDGATYSKGTYPVLGPLINPDAGSTFTLPNVAAVGGLRAFIKASN